MMHHNFAEAIGALVHIIYICVQKRKIFREINEFYNIRIAIYKANNKTLTSLEAISFLANSAGVA